jgi:hypothetical protein
MSALPPIADMCSALAYVRFGPKADIRGLRSDSDCPLSAESGRTPLLLSILTWTAYEGHAGLITIRGPWSMRCSIGLKDRS